MSQPLPAGPNSNPQTSAKIPILLLKTKSIPNDGYEERFSSLSSTSTSSLEHEQAIKNSTSADAELNFEPIFVPVLEHRFLDTGLDVVRNLLREKQFGAGKRYGGLIFTSQRAVEAFASIVAEGQATDHPSYPHLPSIPIYTVGPATSRALSSILSSPPLSIHGSRTGNGEALAHFIRSHYPPLYATARLLPELLFLVGETRRDIIPKTLMDKTFGDDIIGVTELEVYGTGVMASFASDFERILFETSTDDQTEIRWVVVFSPTGCGDMLQALDVLGDDGKARPEYTTRHEEGQKKGIGQGGKTYVATIGPTTRDYLRSEYRFEPHVCAARPSPEGVEEGIRLFMSVDK